MLLFLFKHKLTPRLGARENQPNSTQYAYVKWKWIAYFKSQWHIPNKSKLNISIEVHGHPYEIVKL